MASALFFKDLSRAAQWVRLRAGTRIPSPDGGVSRWQVDVPEKSVGRKN